MVILIKRVNKSIVNQDGGNISENKSMITDAERLTSLLEQCPGW